MRKRSNGFVYHFRWGKPNTPPPQVQEAPKNCRKCSKILTFEDRKAYFGMDEGFSSDLFLQFWNINQAFRATGLSHCGLRNACEVKRRKSLSSVKASCVRSLQETKTFYPNGKKVQFFKYHKTPPIMLKAMKLILCHAVRCSGCLDRSVVPF